MTRQITTINPATEEVINTYEIIEAGALFMSPFLY